jgi:DNA-directed RNA polymerase specialized sigma24 family protein
MGDDCSLAQEDTTSLLRSWAEGSEEAGEDVLRRVYPDLYRLAVSRLMSHELSLEASDLVQDVSLKLLGQSRAMWQDRAHFFAIAARLMRRVLMDHIKHRGRLKRGSGVTKLSLEDVSLRPTSSPWIRHSFVWPRSMPLRCGWWS